LFTLVFSLLILLAKPREESTKPKEISLAIMLKLVALVALVGLVAAETPTASQRANLKLAHDNYVANTKASFAAAEPLYKQAVVDFSATLGAKSFLTKSAKRRYNNLLAHDSRKPAAEQALACEDSCSPTGKWSHLSNCNLQFCINQKSLDFCDPNNAGHAHALNECQKTCDICKTPYAETEISGLSSRALTANELSSVSCTKFGGTVTMDTTSPGTWKFKDIPTLADPGACWVCDITASETFTAVSASYTLVALHHTTGAAQDPDDTRAMTAWGSDPSGHDGYFSFGTPTTIVDAGGWRSPNNAWDNRASGQETRTFAQGTAADTNIVRFGFAQSANHENFSIKDLQITISGIVKQLPYHHQQKPPLHPHAWPGWSVEF
jgi:hypothetical protein